MEMLGGCKTVCTPGPRARSSDLCKRLSHTCLCMFECLLWRHGELPQDWEKQTLGGHKQNLVCTGTQEMGAVTPHETEPDLPVSVLDLCPRLELTVACCGVRGTGYNGAGSRGMLV